MKECKDYKFGLLGLTSELYRQRIPALMDKLGAFQSTLKGILEEHYQIISYGPASSPCELENFFAQLERETP